MAKAAAKTTKAAKGGKRLAWPRGLGETRSRLWWFQHFALLPPKMTLSAVADKLEINYSLARYYAGLFKYEVAPPPDDGKPRRGRPPGSGKGKKKPG